MDRMRQHEIKEKEQDLMRRQVEKIRLDDEKVANAKIDRAA